MAGRKKKYEDKELLDYLSAYFTSECNEVGKKLSYPGFGKYLQAHEIDFSENALKHRPAIIQAMNTLKAGGSLGGTVSDSGEQQEKESSPSYADYKALKNNYKDLLNLFSEAFTPEVARFLLAKEGLAREDDLKAKPEFLEKVISKADEDPFENPFTKRLAEHAKEALRKKKKEEGEGES